MDSKRRSGSGKEEENKELFDEKEMLRKEDEKEQMMNAMGYVRVNEVYKDKNQKKISVTGWRRKEDFVPPTKSEVPASKIQSPVLSSELPNIPTSIPSVLINGSDVASLLRLYNKLSEITDEFMTSQSAIKLNIKLNKLYELLATSPNMVVDRVKLIEAYKSAIKECKQNGSTEVQAAILEILLDPNHIPESIKNDITSNKTNNFVLILISKETDLQALELIRDKLSQDKDVISFDVNQVSKRVLSDTELKKYKSLKNLYEFLNEGIFGKDKTIKLYQEAINACSERFKSQGGGKLFSLTQSASHLKMLLDNIPEGIRNDILTEGVLNSLPDKYRKLVSQDQFKKFSISGDKYS